MSTRREIKPKHEAAVISAAVSAYNKQMGCAFYVKSCPDPPDAILADGNKLMWLEHTDAFYPGWAEDLTSYAASDKEHRPMRKGLHMDMDNIFADIFLEVVLKKLNNKSYAHFVEHYGPGILVVGLESPWLDAETFQAINNKWIESGSLEIFTVFEWIYLGYRDEGKNVAIPWNPYRID